MTKSVRRLSRDSKELSRQTQDTRGQAGMRYDEVLRWLNRFRDELWDSISAASEVACASLTAEETRARDTLETLSNLVSRAVSVTSSNPDVLQLQKDLQAALLGEETLNQYKTLADREEQRMFLNLKFDSSVLDANMIKAYLGELSAAGGQVSQSLKEQLKALDARLHSYEAEVKQAALNRQELNGKVQRINSKIDNTVAFHAWHTASTVKVHAGDKVILCGTGTNKGNSYNILTGIFKAPVSGLYDFQATFMSTDDAEIGLFADSCLYVTGVSNVWPDDKETKPQRENTPSVVFDPSFFRMESQQWNQSSGAPEGCLSWKSQSGLSRQLPGTGSLMAEPSLQHKTTRSHQSSIQALMHLQKNQEVFLKNTSNSAVQLFCGPKERFTTFSGYLVKAD